MSKFKVGDVVRLRAFDDNEGDDWENPGWGEQMAEYVGRPATLTGHNGGGIGNWWQIDLDGGLWCWPEFAMTPYVEPEEATKHAAPDSREGDMRAFFDACIKRHIEHVSVYGDKSFHSSMMSTLTDMEQELLDIANYAAYQHYKLRKLREALGAVRDKLTGKEGEA